MLTESEKHEIEEAIQWYDNLEVKPEPIHYNKDEQPIMEFHRIEMIAFAEEDGVPLYLSERVRSLLINLWFGYCCELPTKEEET